MQNNILWSGIEYYSLENCIIDYTPDGIAINAAIIGLSGSSIYRVEYTLRLDQSWQTKSCLIKAQLDNEIKKTELVKQHEGWSLNGEIRPEFDQCIDVDIPLTPLTNSLPVNRLKLDVGQEKEVDIIYIDLLAHAITHVKQKYRRVSTEIYKYENIPNDFEAEIKIDEEGFVIDYPQLFRRTIKMQSNYHQQVT